jgi:hypothetical protein
MHFEKRRGINTPHCIIVLLCYLMRMAKTTEQIEAIPVAFTSDMTAMADYVRSAAGRQAVERGLSDLQQGRVTAGASALAVELKRRAASRRRA